MWDKTQRETEVLARSMCALRAKRCGYKQVIAGIKAQKSRLGIILLRLMVAPRGDGPLSKVDPVHGLGII